LKSSRGNRNAGGTAARFLSLLLGILIVSPALDPSPAADGAGVTKADSTAFDLGAYHGKVVYLDFWASWCKPCKQSFPWMRDMQARFGSRGLEIVAVSVDSRPEAAEAFLEQNPATFRILHDPEGKMAEAYRIEAMPTAFLYDRGGRQRAVHLGFRRSEAEAWEAEILSLLGEEAPDSTRGNRP
jgi:cytochrome c biogenesis protein CcmG/thiol:disulfide interchange protein DsbE